jgi:hypothetical protein
MIIFLLFLLQGPLQMYLRSDKGEIEVFLLPEEKSENKKSNIIDAATAASSSLDTFMEPSTSSSENFVEPMLSDSDNYIPMGLSNEDPRSLASSGNSMMNLHKLACRRFLDNLCANMA